jgi:hypothetical protein
VKKDCVFAPRRFGASVANVAAAIHDLDVVKNQHSALQKKEQLDLVQSMAGVPGERARGFIIRKNLIMASWLDYFRFLDRMKVCLALTGGAPCATFSRCLAC